MRVLETRRPVRTDHVTESQQRCLTCRVVLLDGAKDISFDGQSPPHLADDVIMSIVLSHSTAATLYRFLSGACPRVPEGWLISHPDFLDCYPTLALARSARSLLIERGVLLDAAGSGPAGPLSGAPAIDVLCSVGVRTRAKGVRCHVLGAELTDDCLIHLGGDVFAVSPELCFLQLAASYDFVRLVELGFELCSGYAYQLDGQPVCQRSPITDVARIRSLISCLNDRPGHRIKGTQRALEALEIVRERTRSPMEAAYGMLLVLPPAMGGLGLTETRMDYRIDLTREAARRAQVSHVVCDAFIPSSRLDIEYNGFWHDDQVRRQTDEERRLALASMGIDCMVVSRQGLLSHDGFARHMRALLNKVGLVGLSDDPDFLFRQDCLRRFVLRNR